jgi:hypothetical protein
MDSTPHLDEMKWYQLSKLTADEQVVVAFMKLLSQKQHIVPRLHLIDFALSAWANTVRQK